MLEHDSGREKGSPTDYTYTHTWGKIQISIYRGSSAPLHVLRSPPSDHFGPKGTLGFETAYAQKDKKREIDQRRKRAKDKNNKKKTKTRKEGKEM